MFSFECAMRFFWKKMDKTHLHQTIRKLFNIRQFNEAGREDHQSSHQLAYNMGSNTLHKIKLLNSGLNCK